MLNSICASTEPWGTPFLSFVTLLLWPLLVCSRKLWLLSISIMKLTMCLSGMVSRRSMCSPRSQTVSYAAVRSRKMVPAFSPDWKLSSMSWHRRVTWSVVDIPLRKPACSLGSWLNYHLNLNYHILVQLLTQLQHTKYHSTLKCNLQILVLVHCRTEPYRKSVIPHMKTLKQLITVCTLVRPLCSGLSRRCTLC